MNTPVKFEIAKLLKEKGFDEKCSHYYINDFQNFKHDGKLYKTSLPNDWDNENIFQYVKRTNQPHLCNTPTIAEVVMWLYEKHGIWTVVNVNIMGSWYFEHFDLKEKRNAQFKPTDTHYDSSTEAYSQAILYTLKNLI